MLRLFIRKQGSSNTTLEFETFEHRRESRCIVTSATILGVNVGSMFIFTECLV